MFSDRRLKTDIRRVGETNDGVPIYTFRFKGSPVTQMGVMAQDVEKRQPRAVVDRGPYKGVRYDRLR